MKQDNEPDGFMALFDDWNPKMWSVSENKFPSSNESNDNSNVTKQNGDSSVVAKQNVESSDMTKQSIDFHSKVTNKHDHADIHPLLSCTIRLLLFVAFYLPLLLLRNPR